jgi:hypothetical protein
VERRAFTTEGTERKSGRFVAFDRKSPAFAPEERGTGGGGGEGRKERRREEV